jgi:hypothetical protein
MTRNASIATVSDIPGCQRLDALDGGKVGIGDRSTAEHGCESGCGEGGGKDRMPGSTAQRPGQRNQPKLYSEGDAQFQLYGRCPDIPSHDRPTPPTGPPKMRELG